MSDYSENLESVFNFNHSDKQTNEIMSLANTNIWFDGIDLVENFYVADNDYRITDQASGSTRSDHVYIVTNVEKGEKYGLLAVSVNLDNQKRLLRGNRSANLQKPIYRNRVINTGITETPLTFAIDFVLIKQEDTWADSWTGRASTPESMKKTWVKAPWTEETLAAFSKLFGQRDFKKLIFGAEKLRPDKYLTGGDKELNEDGAYEWNGDLVQPYFGNLTSMDFQDFQKVDIDNQGYDKLFRGYYGTQYDIEGKYVTYSGGGLIREKDRTTNLNPQTQRTDPYVEPRYYDEYNCYYYNKAGYDVDDLSPLYYNVIPEIGGETDLSVFEGNMGYITVNFQCDAPHGWVDLHKNLRYCQPMSTADEIDPIEDSIDYISRCYLRAWGYCNPSDVTNQFSEYAGYPTIFFHNFNYYARTHLQNNLIVQLNFNPTQQTYWKVGTLPLREYTGTPLELDNEEHGFLFDFDNQQVYDLEHEDPDEINILQKIKNLKYIFTETSSSSEISPRQEGWYIQNSDGTYSLTTDDEQVTGTTYYEKTDTEKVEIWFPYVYTEGSVVFGDEDIVTKLNSTKFNAYLQDIYNQYSQQSQTVAYNNLYGAELKCSFPCTAKKTSHPQCPKMFVTRVKIAKGGTSLPVEEGETMLLNKKEKALIGRYCDRIMYNGQDS